MIVDVKDYLVSKGIRPSVQRVAVMGYILENRIHPTVDDIFGALHPCIPTLSRTTIYNTLELLVSKGAIILLDIDSKFKRYDGDTSLHAHFMCDDCHSVFDLDVKNRYTIDDNIPIGFKVRDIQLLYKGTCQSCSTEKLI